MKGRLMATQIATDTHCLPPRINAQDLIVCEHRLASAPSPDIFHCRECSTPLQSDNVGSLCSGCHNERSF